MSFPQDSRPDTRKLAIARTALILAACSVGPFAAIFAPVIFEFAGVSSDDEGARVVAVIAAVAAVVALATAYALVSRAEKDRELRWMIAMNETEMDSDQREGDTAAGSRDGTPSGV